MITLLSDREVEKINSDIVNMYRGLRQGPDYTSERYMYEELYWIFRIIPSSLILKIHAKFEFTSQGYWIEFVPKDRSEINWRVELWQSPDNVVTIRHVTAEEWRYQRRNISKSLILRPGFQYTVRDRRRIIRYFNTLLR